jgi:polyketide synthase PksL
VYLITGGLGRLFIKEILRKTKDAKVILTGRSELSGQKQTIVEELKALGGQVKYRCFPESFIVPK